MPLFTSEYVFSDDYPTIEPSLRLDFANARALDPRITFTRASVGTYVDKNGLIKNVGVDEPRFDHDPTTGESLGLLIEESRTNQYPISETYASWNVDNNATKTTDGTTIAGLTAVKLTSNVDTNALFLEGNNATFTANTTYTSSVYHKVGNVDGFWFEARFFSGGGTPKLYFNSSTETWSATSGGTAPATWSVKSQKVESNAWRHSITFYIDTDTAGSLRMGALAPANSTNVSTGDYGYLAAPQIEAGSFPTSYIPTSGSTVTRGQEKALITGESFNSFFNPTEGFVMGTYKLNGVNTGNDWQTLVTIDDNTASNRLWLYARGGGDGTQWIGSSGGVTQFAPGLGATATAGIERTIGGAYALNDAIGVYEGTLTTNDTTVVLPVGIDRMGIGFRDDNDSAFINGTIKKLIYYPKRLTNTQLQTLTQ